MSQRELAERAPVGLKIRNGTKVYPGTVALDAVDFDLRMGAVNVLVGENGAGKSTMMKVIAGVERLTSGEILMKDEPVDFHSTDDATKRGIGIAGIEGIDDRLDVGLHCLRDRILVDRFRAFGAASGYKEERRRQYPDTLHHCAPSFVLQLSIASSHLPSVPRR